MKALQEVLISVLFFFQDASTTSVQRHAVRVPSKTWSLGHGFKITPFQDRLDIASGDQIILSAVLPFLSASAGRDNVTESSGAFIISKVDEAQCQGQTVKEVQRVDVDGSTEGTGVQLSGDLLACGNEDHVPYTATFWVPAALTNRVAFELKISPLESDHALSKVYFSFQADDTEDFYGLGAQASFASLKGQSIPIFSREQGVGRGDQPVTSYENA
jgi:hypothetical protein